MSIGLDNDLIVIGNKTIPAEILLMKLDKFDGITIEFQDRFIPQAENFIRLLKRIGLKVIDNGRKRKKFDTQDENGRKSSYQADVNYYKLEKIGYLKKWEV